MTTPVQSPEGSVGQKVAVAATWMVALQVVNRFTGLISLTVLARLLMPADFGLVAMAVAVAAFIDMFAQTQVDVALIRDQSATREDYDSAWTLNILRGLLVGGTLAAAAHPVAGFFSEPRLVEILYAIAVIQLLGSMANIGVVNFRKDFQFQREFMYRFSCRFVGSVLTIALALMWQNVWVLVAGIAARTALSIILSYTLCAYRPRLSLSRFHQIFNFSKWVLVQNLFYELREKVSIFAIARMLNAESLGLFNLAKEISEFVTTELRAPIRRALFPGFARMSAETDELKSGFLAAFAAMLIVSLPLSVGLYLVAPYLVDVLLGPRWAGALPLIEILAIYGIVRSFGTSSHLVYNRIGRTRFTAFINIAHFVVFLPAVVWGVEAYGAEGAAWAITATAALFLIADFLIAKRVIGVRLREFATHSWRPVVAAASMAAVVLAVRSELLGSEGLLDAIGALIVLTTIGATTFVAVDLALWWMGDTDRGAERFFVRTARRLFQARLLRRT